MDFIFKKILIISFFGFFFTLKNKSPNSKLAKKNFKHIKKFLKLKKNQVAEKIGRRSVLKTEQKETSQNIEKNNQIASNFINTMMIDFLPGLIYMPFLRDLFAAIMQKSGTFIQTQLEKLLDALFLDIREKIIDPMQPIDLRKKIILTDETYEKLSQKYRYSFKYLEKQNEMPFVLATSRSNFLEIKKIAFEQKDGFANIKKFLHTMLENKQIYPSDKLKREFVFLPRPTQQKEELVVPITKEAAELFAQGIWRLFTARNHFIEELIYGYILCIWAEVDASVKKNILSYLAKHVKEKNKIKMIYENMMQSYKKNIIYLDAVLKSISSQKESTQEFSFQVAIEKLVKEIYRIKKEKRWNNIKDNFKIAGKVIAGTALLAGAVYFFNPAGAAKGLSWVSVQGTAGLNNLKSMLPSAQGSELSSSNFLSTGISGLIFSPWRKLAEVLETQLSKAQNTLVDKVLFGQTSMIPGERSLLHNLTRDFVTVYATKSMSSWVLPAIGVTKEKYNLNILSKIKSKVSDFIFNQDMYYLFTLGTLFDEVLESSLLLYLFETRVLSLNIGIHELITYRRKNDPVTQELRQGYSIFESGTLKTFANQNQKPEDITFNKKLGIYESSALNNSLQNLKIKNKFNI